MGENENAATVSFKSGWFFLPVFKKFNVAFKNTEANFWQKKPQRYGCNFGYQEKTKKI